MGSFIVRFETDDGPRYCEWSTVVDAPTTEGMTLAHLRRWYKRQFGESGMAELAGRLARADAKGTSAINDKDLAQTVWLNRAGPDETMLSLPGLRALILDGADDDELRQFIVVDPDPDDTGKGDELWLAWCAASGIDPKTRKGQEAAR